MIQLIFTGDNLDQGRVKINDILFTGITSYSPWQFINSATTGFSLEISGITSLSTNNIDTSATSGNLFIGLNNNVQGNGGYNFINGVNNTIQNLRNSFVKGNNNNLMNLSNAFISGDKNVIPSGNSITVAASKDIVFSSSTLNNNYISILGSLNMINGNQPSSSNKKTNFVTILNSSFLRLSANTEYVSVLPGDANIISGDVRNSVILGSSNCIGTGSTGINNNIYIFGNGITPSVSAGTLNALSGTYINNLCIDNKLILNTGNVLLSNRTIIPSQSSKFLNFNQQNTQFITTTSVPGLNVSSTMSASTLDGTNLTGLFFAVYKNNGNAIKNVVGDSNYFMDYDSINSSRWDIPSNTFSANTIFLTRSTNGNYIRFKG